MSFEVNQPILNSAFEPPEHHWYARAWAPVEARLDDCKFLVRFSVAARYPGEVEDPGAEDGRTAQAAAERVRAAMLPPLPDAPS